MKENEAIGEIRSLVSKREYAQAIKIAKDFESEARDVWMAYINESIKTERDDGLDLLLGKTMERVSQSFLRAAGNDGILFECEGWQFFLVHEQNCCEQVEVEDIIGDLDDLVGSPILMAESVSNQYDQDYDNSMTYTFYKFATSKGYVTIRFYGTSNGHYSEEVDFLIKGPGEDAFGNWYYSDAKEKFAKTK